MAGKSKKKLEQEEQRYQKKLEQGRLTPTQIKKHDYKITRNSKLKSQRFMSKTARAEIKNGKSASWFIPPTVIYAVRIIETGHTYYGVTSTKKRENIISEINWKISNNKFCTKKIKEIINKYGDMELTLDVYIVDPNVPLEEASYRKEDLIMQLEKEYRLNTFYQLKNEIMTPEQLEEAKFQAELQTLIFMRNESNKTKFYSEKTLTGLSLGDLEDRARKNIQQRKEELLKMESERTALREQDKIRMGSNKND